MSAVVELISAKEYLEIERKSEVRHEYIDGRMVEKPGSSAKHNSINGNITFVLGSHFRRHSGSVYASAMRIRVPAIGCYMYPDVVAITGKPELEEEELDVLLNPTVIFEVLSDSTANYDRGEKFQHYRTIESLQEYLMVAQNAHRIEHYVFSEATHIGETIHLPSIDCDLPLTEVYFKVEIEHSVTVTDMNGQHL